MFITKININFHIKHFHTQTASMQKQCAKITAAMHTCTSNWEQSVYFTAIVKLQQDKLKLNYMNYLVRI